MSGCVETEDAQESVSTLYHNCVKSMYVKIVLFSLYIMVTYVSF